MDEKQITPVEPQIHLGIMRVETPRDVIVRATEVAKELSKIVEDKKLFTMVGKRKHVHVEGWTTLGAMLGIVPCELNIKRLEDGAYEATVELIRSSDGKLIGRASALCGMDEKDRYGKPTWATRPEYARRSMAVTRATGKAFRLGFSWIMTLAGYAPTPAEEIGDDVIEGEIIEAQAKPAGPDIAGEIDQLGSALWPGLWAEKRAALFENLKTDEKVLGFVRQRMGEITKPDGFKLHVTKSWPGSDAFISEIVAALGENFNQLQAIAEIAKADKASNEAPALSNGALLEIILREMPK